jgi:hypothetical protein
MEMLSRIIKIPQKLNVTDTIHDTGVFIGNRKEDSPIPQVRVDFFKRDVPQVFELGKTDRTTHP